MGAAALSDRGIYGGDVQAFVTRSSVTTHLTTINGSTSSYDVRGQIQVETGVR
jgi:hypothetical protein